MNERIFDMVDGIVAAIVDLRCAEGNKPDRWDLAGIETDVNTEFGARVTAEGDLRARRRSRSRRTSSKC